MKKIKVGLIQMAIEEKSKETNIKRAREMINKVADLGAEIVALPEMFNCAYSNRYFREFSEEYPSGETIKMLSEIARVRGIYLIGGSIPELYDGKVYNTSFIFNNEGNLIGRHRKIHLFDINIKDGAKFMESKTLSPGRDITIFDTPWGKMGVVICYDIRFPELLRIMALEGCRMIFIPAAFNMTTGPAHWETLFKGRALDNQVYCLGISPARNEKGCYVAYGNSIITSPFGQIIKRLDEKEDIIVEELDLDYIDEIRNSLPLIKHRREDVYTIKRNGDI